MFNFIGSLFSLLKGIYNTCAIHTQLNRQASVARILFAGFLEFFPPQFKNSALTLRLATITKSYLQKQTYMILLKTIQIQQLQHHHIYIAYIIIPSIFSPTEL